MVSGKNADMHLRQSFLIQAAGFYPLLYLCFLYDTAKLNNVTFKTLTLLSSMATLENFILNQKPELNTIIIR